MVRSLPKVGIFFMKYFTGTFYIVKFLCPQGIVLLQKSYYSEADLVLKSRFMTFRIFKAFSHISGLYLMKIYRFFNVFIPQLDHDGSYFSKSA